MRNDDIEEQVAELAKIQYLLNELCPDIEKVDLKIQEYPELTQALLKQNAALVDKIQELGEGREDIGEFEQIRYQNEMLEGQLEHLRQENESLLKSIECLGKQVELYKTKSSGEIDRKVAMLETKAKLEAKEYKQQYESILEVMQFKEDKITEMQQEIERLKYVLKTESVKTERHPQRPSAGKHVFERRLDEIAQKGKLEYKILVAPDETQTNSKKNDTEKILSVAAPSFMATLGLQSQMLEERLQENTEIREKFEELVNERSVLEEYVNTVLEQEKQLSDQYGNLLAMVDEFLNSQDGFAKRKIRQQITALNNSWKNQNPNENGAQMSDSPIASLKASLDTIKEEDTKKSSPIVVERPPTVDNKLIQIVEKLLEERKLPQACEELKNNNYEIIGENPQLTIERLKLICRIRDKQIDKLLKECASPTEALKKISELTQREIDILLNEYQESKKVFESKPFKVMKNDSILRGEFSEIQEDNMTKEEEIVTLTEENERLHSIIKAQELKMTRLEQNNTGSSKFLASPSRIEMKSPVTEFTSDPMPKKDQTMQIAALEEENKKNRALINELLAAKNSANPTLSKAHQILAQNNHQLADQVKELSEEIDSLSDIIKDLHSEHTASKGKLELILQSPFKKSSPTLPSARDKIQKSLLSELQSAKEISLLIAKLNFSIDNGDMALAREKIQEYNLQMEQLKDEGTQIYKQFFTDESRSHPITIEILLEKIRKKNLIFKQLHNQYENLLQQNEELLKKPIAEMSNQENPEIAKMQKQNEEQNLTIKELMFDIKSLKEQLIKPREEKQIAEKELRQLKQENQKLRTQQRQIDETTSENNKKFASLQEEIAQMQYQIEEEQNKSKKLLEELSSLCRITTKTMSFPLIKDFQSGLAAVKNIREQLADNRQLIETLQASLNAVQKERQLQYKTTPLSSGRQAGSISFGTPRSAKLLNSSAELSSIPKPDSQYKLLTQKYENWFDDLQDIFKRLGEEIHDVGIRTTWRLEKPKLSLKEMQEIITQALEVIPKLREEIASKDSFIAQIHPQLKSLKAQEQIASLKKEDKSQELYISELEVRLQKMHNERIELEHELDKLRNERIINETELRREREEKLTLINSFRKESEDSSRIKLDRAKQEGILFGQKQSRSYRDEEIRKLEDTMTHFKTENIALKSNNNHLQEQMKELESYNQKANTEVVQLIDALKNEQSKQRLLSGDLEALTKEFSPSSHHSYYY